MDGNRNETYLQRFNSRDCCYKTFDGLRIDTCANRTSVIIECQYQAYCYSFNLPFITRPSGNQIKKGNGGSSTSSGIFMIQVPFNYLDFIIDVSFLIIKEDVPTLLSMRDLLKMVSTYPFKASM